MQDQSISAAGAVVYWSCNQTDQERLNAELDRLGLGDYKPQPRTDASALREALKLYAEEQTSVSAKKADKLKQVQPHKQQSKNGFEVVDVERGEDRNYYTQDFSCKVEDGQVTVSRGWADKAKIQRLFHDAQRSLTGAAVGQSLVEILRHLNGLPLRPSGGIYWIPEEAVATWVDVSRAVEEAGESKAGNKCYLLRTQMDDAALRAVRDAIVSDVVSVSSTIREEIETGTLGELALDNRKAAAVALHERVKRYEGYLGEALAQLHAVVNSVEQAATLAAMQGIGV